MTGPYTVPPPMMPPRRTRRTGRRVLILIIVLLAVLGLLVGLDRAAAAYAAGRIATKLQANGFPVRPDVSVEGFPFLTQVLGHHLDGVKVTAPKFPVGAVDASVNVQASNIMLSSGYQSGTIARVTGTGLITFASLATLPALAAVPGLTITGAGPHLVKLTANLQIIAASAIARVNLAGPHAIALRIVSASGVPAALLGPIRHLIVPVPKLPLGLTVQSVTVNSSGVVIGVTGSNVPFGQ
jgi:LmeA-like phospholipid-binding